MILVDIRFALVVWFPWFENWVCAVCTYGLGCFGGFDGIDDVVFIEHVYCCLLLFVDLPYSAAFGFICFGWMWSELFVELIGTFFVVVWLIVEHDGDVVSRVGGLVVEVVDHFPEVVGLLVKVAFVKVTSPFGSVNELLDVIGENKNIRMFGLVGLFLRNSSLMSARCAASVGKFGLICR